MYKTIFKYLEDTAIKYPKKIAFCDSKRQITYEEFVNESKEIANTILNREIYNKPIAIYMDKNIDTLKCMIGINYSGNFYTIIDNKMPIDRVNNILSTLDPMLILTNKKNIDKLSDISSNIDIVLIEDIKQGYNQNKLDEVYNKIVDTNTMYILFTSGSTGNPKGTVLSHRAVISYINWFSKTFNISDKTIFGSQTPFYFSMSVSDVFSTMVTGATFYIIPKMLFSFPLKLVEFLNENSINTIYWVPSALCIVANFKTLDSVVPKYLEKVLFAGEVMPMKQLNMWMKKLPNVMYANLFGPTETVDICSYYIVNRKFKDSDTLPIGNACDNCDLIVINERNELVNNSEEGELFVRGSFLCSGYYKNLEKTNEALVQNPLNSYYPELVYKTGDIVKYNKLGELEYVSRKDFQIKHMGYRIELGEIESSINSIKDIDACVCIYDMDSSKIVLFYMSNKLDNEQVLKLVKKKVPNYMVPQEIIKLTSIPYNANGKMDRKKLMSEFKEGKF